MKQLRYDDFDLKITEEITRKGKQYKAQVLESPCGEASHVFDLPFNDIKLENLILRLGQVRGSKRRGFSDEMKAAREIGGKLFEAVFGGDVKEILKSSIDKTRKEPDVGLRLKLKLQDVPELANIPWEFLFYEKERSFLAQSNQTPIVRYSELARGIKPLRTKAPIRILVMISSPSDLPQLDVEHEWKLLKKAFDRFEKHNIIEIRLLEKATSEELMRTLQRGTYHIFHYIGHSQFDERQEIGVLAFEDEYGKSSFMRSDHLATILNDHQSIRLVVLNSCESARGSRTDPFAGVATSLIQKGIPAVIAMQFDITDKAAIVFAKWFYLSLAQGFPVDAAVAEARKAIFMIPNDVEWGTPVLYMRSKSGDLFDLDPQEVRRVAEVEDDILRDNDGPPRNVMKYVIGGLCGIGVISLLFLLVIPWIRNRGNSRLKITSEPSNAFVDIDAERQERNTPSTYPVSPIDTHVVIVGADGFSSDTFRYFGKKGEIDSIHRVLQQRDDVILTTGLISARDVIPIRDVIATGLFVRSDPPGAQVFINYRATTKRTPVTIELEAGGYTIELKKENDNPAYEYYKRRSVNITSNKVDSIDIPMERGLKPVITVRSVPKYAEILIDEIFVGNTDRSISVFSGKHTIQLRAPGYRPYTYEINVAPEEERLLPIVQLVPN